MIASTSQLTVTDVATHHRTESANQQQRCVAVLSLREMYELTMRNVPGRTNKPKADGITRPIPTGTMLLILRFQTCRRFPLKIWKTDVQAHSMHRDSNFDDLYAQLNSTRDPKDNIGIGMNALPLGEHTRLHSSILSDYFSFGTCCCLLIFSPFCVLVTEDASLKVMRTSGMTPKPKFWILLWLL